MSTILPIPADIIPPGSEEMVRILNIRLGNIADEIEASATATGAAASSGDFLYGTRAQRLSIPAESVPAGTRFYETDNTVFYEALPSGAAARVWTYRSGVKRGTLSPNQKPTLTADDAGFLFYSTDFAHTYRWSGSAWAYAAECSDPGSGFIGWWIGTPNDGGVWHICDGTAGVSRSSAGGGVATFTVPDLIGVFLKGAAAYTGAVVPAVNPGISGSTASGNAVLGAPNSTAAFSTGGATNGATHIHTHTDSGHTHGSGTLAVDDTGEPAHLELIPHIRL